MRALAHVVRGEEIILGAGDDIDNGIAETENVVAGGGHVAFTALEGEFAHYSGGPAVATLQLRQAERSSLRFLRM